MHEQELYTPENEFELDADGQNYVIKKYTGSDRVVSIPPTIRGRKVTNIRDYAFVEEVRTGFLKFEYHGIVEKVIIPETMTQISGVAFWKCNTLKEVVAHPGMESIGSGCFFGCDNLKKLDFGMGEVSPGMVKLPQGLKTLGGAALNKSNGECIFKEVLMSKRTKWKKSAFGNLEDAFNATTCAVFYYEDGIPGENLRAYESAISQQYTPEDEFELINEETNYAIKRYIGNRTVVSVPPVIRGRKVVKLGDLSFARGEKVGFMNIQDVSAVEKVILPETVTEIGTRAFYCCGKLHTVIAHPGIRVIDSLAFANCTNLKKLDFGMGLGYPGVVRFPKNLKKLGNQCLAVDLLSNKCLFEEVIVPRNLRIREAFNIDSCRVFYYE